MLATHTIDPEYLYTITAGGFSATADAFARDDATDGLWFVSMVGSQTALKAIWASLLKQPPDVATGELRVPADVVRRVFAGIRGGAEQEEKVLGGLTERDL